MGDSPRKFKCLVENQITDRRITLIDASWEPVQRSTSDKWHLRLRTVAVWCPAYKAPTQQLPSHYVLSAWHYLLAPASSFYTAFLRMLGWKQVGVFFSFKNLPLGSIFAPSFSPALFCFWKPGLCSSASCCRDFPSQTPRHHPSDWKQVFSAAFS